MQNLAVFEQLGDADFQEKLIAEPQQTLAQVNIKVPTTTQVKVVRNERDRVYMVIPVKHAKVSAITDEDLTQIVAGEAALYIGFVATLAVVASVAVIGSLGYLATELFAE